ncbi:MAG: class I tRNA ligase family protein, partial [Bacteroidales bacterium]|nr:class I tRNA ligase family protein [Bacteroidales bacterium]
AHNTEEALQIAQEKYPELNLTAADLKQDEDVMDTWFSSWLWPISVFDPEMPGHPDHKPNADLAYYYPTNDLVTGPDIIFFWVARMIMAGEEFMGKEPFSNVYFTGIVRDKIGRKMSKTLGNSPNPLDLIENYGADAVRIGMLLCSSAGNDIFYDEAQIKQGAAFCNKIWNSYRLVKGFQVADIPQTESQKVAVEWFRAKLSETIGTVEDHYSKFRISDALMTIYKLFWDDYCSAYLEAIKPAFGQPVDPETQKATLGFFEALLKLIHPVMPFITEELWQDLAERKEGETIMYAPTPKAEPYDAAVLDNFALAMETVNGVRGIRNQRNIGPKEALSLKIKAGSFPCIPLIEKMAGVKVELVQDLGEGQGAAFLVRTTEMGIPLTGMVNVEEEIEKAQKDLEYQQKFLAGIRGKLSNERFVNNAPAAVIENERKKEADTLSRIETLEAKLKQLKESK